MSIPLPTKDTFLKSGIKPGECEICREPFSADDDHACVEVDRCGHYFGRRCLLNWLELKADCPRCRTPLFRQRAVLSSYYPRPSLIDLGQQRSIGNRSMPEAMSALPQAAMDDADRRAEAMLQIRRQRHANQNPRSRYTGIGRRPRPTLNLQSVDIHRLQQRHHAPPDSHREQSASQAPPPMNIRSMPVPMYGRQRAAAVPPFHEANPYQRPTEHGREQSGNHVQPMANGNTPMLEGGQGYLQRHASMIQPIMNAASANQDPTSRAPSVTQLTGVVPQLESNRSRINRSTSVADHWQSEASWEGLTDRAHAHSAQRNNTTPTPNSVLSSSAAPTAYLFQFEPLPATSQRNATQDGHAGSNTEVAPNHPSVRPAEIMGGSFAPSQLTPAPLPHQDGMPPMGDGYLTTWTMGPEMNDELFQNMLDDPRWYY